MTFTNPKNNISNLNLNDGMTVVDLGSGAGAYSLIAAKEVGSGKVYAVDVQNGLLERLSRDATEKGLSNIEVVSADLENIRGSGLKDNSADALIISNILFLIDNKDSFVKEAGRILRPEGRALIIEWSDSYGGLGPQPEHILSESDAVSLFERNGFRIEKKLLDAGEHHYGFIAKLSKSVN
jgi:ubiquinone/menaquinone biosynthesis C-methylase UbiE